MVNRLLVAALLTFAPLSCFAGLLMAAPPAMASDPDTTTEDGEGALWEKLAPVQRAKLLMAMLGFVLLALVMLVVILVGARMVRRRARAGTGPSQHVSDPWFRPESKAEPPDTPLGGSE